VSGVVTEARGQLWTWPFAVLPAALLLVRRPEREDGPAARTVTATRAAATGLLAILAVGGVLAWRADIAMHQAVRQQYAAIAVEATAHEPGTPSPTVIVFQDPRLAATRSGQIMASTLMMAVHEEQGGAIPVRCSPTDCFDVATRLALDPEDRNVVRLGTVGGRDLVAVVVPTPPSWI